MAAASRIAQRSRSGLVLRTPLPGPAGTGAPIATIHCPARAVTVHDLDYSPWPAEPSYDAVGRPGLGGSNGTLRHESRWRPPHTGSRWARRVSRPSAPRWRRCSASSRPRPTPGPRVSRPPRSPASAPTAGCPSPRATAGTPRRRTGRRALRAAGRPARRGAVRGHADLRGRRVGLVPRRGGRRQRGRLGVTGDREWRAAAERANQQPEDVTFTAEGLPRRRAGARLVPPRLSDGGAGDGAGRGGAHARPAAAAAPADRVPDRVRERAGHLPARAAPGQAPRRAARPGRSRRLVAACCSSCRTCRSSHRAVD